MTQEERQLLFKDLSARLHHGVKVSFQGQICTIDTVSCDATLLLKGKDGYVPNIEEGLFIDIDRIKPYLRPMSSMTEDETKELLFVRLEAKYGKSCAYIINFIKLNEVSFRKEPPYAGSVAIWFSFENKIVHGSKIREYSKCEYLGQINDITLAEIDWLLAHHFDYRGLIEKGLAIEVTKEDNPYEN